MAETVVRELAEGVQIVHAGNSETWIKSLGGGGVFMRMKGYYTAEQFDHQIPTFRKAVDQHGIFHMWVDSWEFKNYETPFRTRWTAFFAEVADAGKMGGVHMVISSPVVRMGVSVANLFLKKIQIQVYDDQATFMAALKKQFPTCRDFPSAQPVRGAA